MNLDEAACHFETDKGTRQRRGGPGHGYALVYEKELARFGHCNVHLLEVGVQAGCSLRLWDWWAAEGNHRAAAKDPIWANLWKIVGMEVALMPGIEAAVKATARAPDHIFVEEGDSTSFSDCKRVADAHGPFDVVIDDGDHLPASQVKTLVNLWPAVKPGGIYCLEDLHESFWDPLYPDAQRGSILPTLHGLIEQCLGRGRFATWGPVPPMPEPEDSDRAIAGVRFYRNMVVLEKAS